MGRLERVRPGLVRLAGRARVPRAGPCGAGRRVRRQPAVRSEGPASVPPAALLARGRAGFRRRPLRRFADPQSPGRGLVPGRAGRDRPVDRASHLVTARSRRRESLARGQTRLPAVRNASVAAARGRERLGHRPRHFVAETRPDRRPDGDRRIPFLRSAPSSGRRRGAADEPGAFALDRVEFRDFRSLVPRRGARRRHREARPDQGGFRRGDAGLRPRRRGRPTGRQEARG